MTIHIDSGDGGAKCGCNVTYDNYPNGYQSPKVEPAVRRILRKYLYFENEAKGFKANCKRCLNKVARPTIVISDEDLTGKVFHYSFGYDMTINVFAKVIKKTKKGYICQEVDSLMWGAPYAPGSTGKARASNEFKDGSKPFLMTCKQSARSNYKYWSGGGRQWSLAEPDEVFYENHWD